MYSYDRNQINFQYALSNFQKARRTAAMQEIVSRITGSEMSLLQYEDIRRQLKAIEQSGTKTEVIPLNAIVGSVNRYDDFTRTFLPRTNSARERWVGVMEGLLSPAGLPPIDVYKVGDIYFVKDGNHRASVARWLGFKDIQAFVTVVPTSVDLSPDMQMDQLITNLELANFMARTRLDTLRPQVDIHLTAPGKVEILNHQIEAIYREMVTGGENEGAYPDSVLYWCDNVYMPVVETIRGRKLLRNFPGRTETDLYVWITEYQGELCRIFGSDLGVEPVSINLPTRHGTTINASMKRLKENFFNTFVPTQLKVGPPPGKWRQERFAEPSGQIFSNILVLLSDDDPGLGALEMGLEFAKREDANLFGLYVVQIDDSNSTANIPDLQVDFEQRIQAAGVTGNLISESGRPINLIMERARWMDLVVFAHKQSDPGFTGHIHTLAHRINSPFLLVKGDHKPPKRVMMAYDGSTRAKEALFLAAYMGVFWEFTIDVVSVQDKQDLAQQTLENARAFLESYGKSAGYIQKTGEVPDSIFQAATEKGSDLILIGGHSSRWIKEAVYGSTVDHILSESPLPVLVCN